MLQRRIELCGDAPRAQMQPCKQQVWPPTASPPAQGWNPPEQVQRVKSQEVRATESPVPLDNSKQNRNLCVRFFGGGTLRSALMVCGRGAQIRKRQRILCVVSEMHKADGNRRTLRRSYGFVPRLILSVPFVPLEKQPVNIQARGGRMDGRNSLPLSGMGLAKNAISRIHNLPKRYPPRRRLCRDE